MKDTNYLAESQTDNTSEIAEQIYAILKNLGLTKPIKGRGIISGVETHPIQGYPVSAIAQINGADNQILEVGANHRIVEGEVWDFIAEDDDAIGRTWIPRRLVITNQVAVAPDNTRPFPVLVIPSDGVVVLRDQDYFTDPNGPVNTRVFINYRTIVPGLYDIFAFGMKEIHIQIRELGTLIWTIKTKAQIEPAVVVGSAISPIFLTLAGTFSPVATAMTVSIPDGFVASQYIVGQPVYWKVNDEVFDGIFNGTNTIGTIINRSPTPTADHDIGTRVTLLSGQIDIGGLRAGLTNPDGTANNVDYEAQIAAGDSFNNHGPYSVLIPFSGFRVILPPDPVTDLDVNQVKAGIAIEWTRPQAPNIRGFNIYRSTISVADGEIADTASLPGTMRLIATTTRNASSFLVPHVDPARVFYEGNYFGVETIDTSGGRSPVVWGSDTTPPPNPNPANVTYEPGAFSITVNVSSAETASADESWYAYVLLSADDTDGDSYNGGAGPVIIGEFTGNTFTFSVTPDKDAKVYQVVSRDWANPPNTGSPTNNTTYWKYVPSFYWTDKIPLNGNFQLGNAENTFARYWEVITGTFNSTPMLSDVTWTTSGGLYGNKTIRGTYIPSTLYHRIGIRQTIAIPVNALLLVTGGSWVRFTFTGGNEPGATMYSNLELQCYSDDEGTVYLGTINQSTYEGDLAGPFTSGEWYHATVSPTIYPIRYYFPTCRTIRAVLTLNTPDTTAGKSYILDVDDFRIELVASL